MGIVIFNRKVGMKLEPFAEGILVADGMEQLVVENPVLSILTGYLGLGNLQAGDTVIIRQYVKLDGTYGLYASETYSGIQTEPTLHFTGRPSMDKIKLTLEQTAGVMKSFAYQFIREV
jgi:hypothetical protein